MWRNLAMFAMVLLIWIMYEAFAASVWLNDVFLNTSFGK